MIKLLTFDNLFPPLNSRRMTMAIMFSCQNDTGSPVSNTWYWENLVLIVVLVSESKGLYSHFCVHPWSMVHFVVPTAIVYFSSFNCHFLPKKIINLRIKLMKGRTGSKINHKFVAIPSPFHHVLSTCFWN